MFGCLLYIYNTNEACFFRLREFPYAPHTFGCPCMFGHPLYVWMSLIPLDATIDLAASNIQGGSQTYGGHPNRERSKHRRHPNIWGECKHGGCPNIQGTIQTYDGIQTSGGIQMYGGIWTPLHLTKHAFFVLCMYRGHPNVWGYMDTSLV